MNRAGRVCRGSRTSALTGRAERFCSDTYESWQSKNVAMKPCVIGLLCLIICTSNGEGARIIAVPLPGAPSHIYAMYKICDRLIIRGHEVLMVLAEGDINSLTRWDLESKIKIISHRTVYKEVEWREQSRLARFKDPVSGGIIGVKMWARTCDVLLGDDELLERIREYKANIVFGDWAYFCQLAIAEKLKLPRVTFSNVPIIDPVHTTWDKSTGRRMNIPNILAYVPQVGTGLQSPMGFLGRIKNTVSYAVIQFVDYFIFHQMIYRPLGKKHGIDMGSREALRRGILNLFNVDFALEYPRPLVPSVKLIGPVMPEEPQELRGEMQEFYKLYEDSGIVYVSFGTVCSLDKTEIEEVAIALSQLPVGVLWKLDPAELPANMGIAELNLRANVKVVRWAPQNDILGHPLTRAFLTHGGINGLYEAAYHATPIVGLPMIADQLDNVMKAVHHGFGLQVSPKRGIKSVEIGLALRTILENDSYQKAAARVSKRLKSRIRAPAEEGADWVEHALNTSGDPYLRTPEDDLSVFVLFGMDVGAALSIIVLLPLFLFVIGWRRFRRKIAKRVRLSATMAPHYVRPGVTANITVGMSIKDKNS
eukprot:jgi/Botrbrau1/18414/Bobra.0072s0007.1